jgi:hypothetical protein
MLDLIEPFVYVAIGIASLAIALVALRLLGILRASWVTIALLATFFLVAAAILISIASAVSSAV